jgi:hypothetical protein
MARVVWSGPNLSALLMASSSESRVRARWTLDRPYRGLTDRSRLLVGKARRADQKEGLALGGRQLCKRVTEIFEFHPAVLLGRRFQAVEVAAVGVLDFAALLSIFRPEQVSQAHMFVPGWNELMLPMARRRVSCTRSSARSTLPQSEIANARKLGTAASMASRTGG